MKTGAKLIVFHQNLNKQGLNTLPFASHRILLLIFISFFAFAFALSLFYPTQQPDPNSPNSGQLPDPVFDALLHYATANISADIYPMSAAEVAEIAAALRRCRNKCNFLVFGLTHETLLWRSLNLNGRTVFIDSSAYNVKKTEEENRGIEAYDVVYTTKVSELYDLLEYAKHQIKKDCKPVQNLLYSDCKLAINDLPNFVYEVVWDVILVDGPSGNSPAAPGRSAAVFTAAVLGRSSAAVTTEVFVHDVGREVERVSSERFLCRGNLVNSVGVLGHFVIKKAKATATKFCSKSSSLRTSIADV